MSMKGPVSEAYIRIKYIEIVGGWGGPFEDVRRLRSRAQACISPLGY